MFLPAGERANGPGPVPEPAGVLTSRMSPPRDQAFEAEHALMPALQHADIPLSVVAQHFHHLADMPLWARLVEGR